MTAKIIDGKTIAQQIRDKVRDDVSKLVTKPGLAVVLVGDDPASHTYVGMKKKACLEAGINSFSHELPASTTEEDLLELIAKLNQQPEVHGILVQSPVPKHINEHKIVEAINPQKDVDGFHPMTPFVSCTPGGIIELIDSTGVEIKGKKAVIIGRSHIVGKPTAALLLDRDATVTICHRHTQNLAEEAKQADILVVAVGKANLVTGAMIKPGAVVIDVGINRVDGKLVGDVEFDSAKKVAGYLTPVPGGVGPMTIAILMRNTLEAAKKGA